MSVDEFRELSKVPRQAGWRIAVQVYPDACHVAVYDTNSEFPGGKHAWSRRYARPEGKTLGECLEAMLRATQRALEDGLVC